MKDIDGGWAWVVLGAASFNLVILGTMTMSIGMFQLQFQFHFNESIAYVSFICAVCGSLQSLLGPVTGVICNIFGIRTAMMLGSALLSLGLVSSSFASSANQLLVFYGIIAGTGFGMVYSPSIIVVGHYFQKNRVLATGLALSCTGVGMMSLPHCLSWLIDRYDWRYALAIFGFLASQMVIASSLVFPLDSSAVEETNSPEHRVTCCVACKGAATAFSKSLSILKNKILCVYSISYFSDCMGYSVQVVHLPSYVRWVGVSHERIPSLFTVYGITLVISRVLGGAFCNDKTIDLLVVAIACLGLKGIAVAFMPFYAQGFISLVFYEVFFALYFGLSFVLMSPVLIDLMGTDNLATTFGVTMFFGGCSYLIGPTLAGFIFDTTGSYATVFHIAGSFIILSALVLATIPLIQDRKCPEHETEIMMVESL